MTKMKKYSLPYWVKKCMNAWTPEKDILAAVQEFVKNGTHSQIEFSGTPLEFAHALYLERFKRGTPWAGFFPTPTWLADQAAALLGFQPGQVVLDPGCGFGSLSQAVERHGGIPVMVEYSNAVVPIAQALWGEERGHYADFTDGFRPPKFDAVITNPSFGKVFGHSDAALDFLNRIADVSPAGMRVAAILPRGYLKKDRPKANAEMRRRYRVLDEIELPADAFAPLTKIATTLYLLRVQQDGRLINELQPVRSAAVIERESKPESSATEAVSEVQPVLSKQLTGDAAVAFLSEINQRCPAPDYPQTADGRPRALLPDELIERLKANSRRTLQPKRTDYYTVWSDDALALMRAKGCDQWVACSATRDGEYRPLSLVAHSEAEFVQGATLFEALDALREHLTAWWGLVPRDTRINLRPYHPAWDVMSIRELLEIVNTHEIVLIADEDLGIPTIHDQPQPEHMGFGTFRSQTAEYAINWDAGGSMNRLLNGQGWTDVHVEWGAFPYDQACVTQTLERWASELSGTPSMLRVQPTVSAEPVEATPVTPIGATETVSSIDGSAQSTDGVAVTVEVERIPTMPKRPKELPADIPAVIEVDVGERAPQWIAATIVKVTRSQQLVCRRSDGRGELKTPIYGRDITWRTPAAI
jgi:predicted RNA methylase